ncbi:MAG: beta-propeller fold lactonase family protein [Spirochaetales bacterium]|nr:beta-propeller fold lactonase family protein [Spirochaetales bacterium]
MKSTFAIGTYTDSPGLKERGAGILLLELDESTGQLTEKFRYKDVENPSYLSYDSSTGILFAVSENIEDCGLVSSFQLIENRTLEQIPRVSGPGLMLIRRWRLPMGIFFLSVILVAMLCISTILIPWSEVVLKVFPFLSPRERAPGI